MKLPISRHAHEDAVLFESVHLGLVLKQGIRAADAATALSGAGRRRAHEGGDGRMIARRPARAGAWWCSRR